MGLFDKKFCDICGERIKLLGNRKLEDGNLCKDCAAKLSPWFSDRRSSTVEDIKAQLAYREENKAAVAAFHTTRVLGYGTKVLLDEDAGLFMVTSARQYEKENPDVLKFSQVTGCTVDIDEDKDEEMRSVKKADGSFEKVSYVPPRYIYRYDFYVSIRVNAPYFDEIRFRLNDSGIEIRPPASSVRNFPGRVPGARGSNVLGSVLQGVAGAVADADDFRMRDTAYAQHWNMAQEIREALTQIRAQTREAIEQANAPKAAVTCPWCGATTTPDAAGTCEYCGGAVNG